MRRFEDQGGASAVEFAILAPLIFMLIFGMLFGALAWNAKQGLSHAVREAARFGATVPFDDAPAAGACPAGTDPWLDAVAMHAVASAEGQLGACPGDTYDAYGRTWGTYVCVAYFDGSTWTRDIWDSSTMFDPPALPNCHDDGITSTGSRLQVHVGREQLFQAVLVGRPLFLQSVASARHEVLE